MKTQSTRTRILAGIIGLFIGVMTLPLAAAPNDIDRKVDAAANAYRAGRYNDAAKLFREIVRLDPKHAEAWHLLGQSLVKTGQTMEARTAFGRALEIEPSGKLAERTREALAKLPVPDLFTLPLDSGLTLGDWLPIAEQQAAQGKGEAVLRELSQHLRRFGPLPQLVVLQDKITKQMQAEQAQRQAEQEKRLQQAVAAIRLTHAASAQTALPRIRQLKAQAPGNLNVLRLEARACHLMRDFACAEAAYAAWLKTAPGRDSRRKNVVAALMMVKQREALPSAVAATGEVIRDCPECPEMVVLSAGIFEMGEANDKHTVTFAQAFAIGKTEVTQGQWQAVMGNNPSHFKDCGVTCPVEQVSWDDAQEFIKRLNAKTGKQYRLPSEAEWEAACRGGEEQEYCGSDDINSVAWYGGSYMKPPTGNSGDKTRPVATKQPNAFGLYDMSGNVLEWVQDCIARYSSVPTDGSAWTSGECKHRVLRGGSWDGEPQGARAAYRRSSSSAPANRSISFGLRLARTLP